MVSDSKWVSAHRRVVVLLALIALACASSGSGAADAPDEAGVDCSALSSCDDKLQCGGGARCFKLKSCSGFVCAEVKTACRSECGAGADCLVLESQPMMLSCR